MRGWIVIGILIALIGWSSAGFIQSQSLDEKLSNEDRGIAKGQAPDFTLLTLQNETVSLSEFKGKPVIINFWATWCPPCRAEMPHMQRLYKENDVVILAVNVTSSESHVSDVENFVQELGLSFPVLLDEQGEIGALYQVRPLPTSIFVDREGFIHKRHVGPMNVEMMERVFEEFPM
ncbi:TlpA family protein disulfide reductase [bacterium LRH843]|nr:TlpA family protein disulfide reductase [bacterium LRH843]